MNVDRIHLKSTQIRNRLKQEEDFTENPIDITLTPALPFCVSEHVRLIVIGQDPTVKSVNSRRTVTHTLNLNRKGSLTNYIFEICRMLDIDFKEIYATNVFKYFYTVPPERTMHVLQKHLEPNLELLKIEIGAFKNAIIVTLGLPVLRLLTNEKAEVSEYWNYNKQSKKTGGNFKVCAACSNKLGLDFYPLPHQPSIIKEFYKTHLKDYLQFVQKNKVSMTL